MEANDFQKRYQGELDAVQVKLLSEIETDRGAAIAYTNACINSGIGALRHHLVTIGKPEIADAAIGAVLHTWLMLVTERLDVSAAAK